MESRADTRRYETAHIERLNVLVPWEDHRSFYTKFRHTAEAVEVPVFVCAIIGVTLIAIAVLTLHDPAKEILVHIGGAFLVAGIVTFGYEWGRDVGEVKKLTANLVGQLSEVADDILGATTRESVRNGMNRLTNGSAPDLADQIPKLGEYIGRLQISGGWAAGPCITYLQTFQSQLIARASELSTLTSPYEATTDIRIDLPDTVKLVDVLVESLMRAMLINHPTAEYLAVSDMSTWTKMHGLSRVHSEAVAVIPIRRIFVLGLPSDRQLLPEQIYKILKQHSDEATNTKYAMRLLTLGNYLSAHLQELGGAKHFGIFMPGGSDPAVALVVRDDGVSRLRLLGGQDNLQAEFDLLWALAESADSNVATTDASGAITRPREVVLDDFLMAYFITRLPGDGSYHGISYLSKWHAGNYAVFAHAMRESLRRPGVQAQRILVMDVSDNKDWRARDIVEQHRQLRQSTNGRYEFRTCEPAKVAGELAELIPVGFLATASEDEPARVIVDRAQPNRQYARASEDENRRLLALFNELWNQSTPDKAAHQ